MREWFPNKHIQRVSNGLRSRSIRNFLARLPLVFQRGRAEGLDAVYHFMFTGDEQIEATIVIREKDLQIQEGHVGSANIRVTADSNTWLGFVAKERSLLWAMLTRRIRLKGSPKWLVAFGKCFPS